MNLISIINDAMPLANEQIHYTGQYLVYKSVYAQFRKARNKEEFRNEHSAGLFVYPADEV